MEISHSPARAFHWSRDVALTTIDDRTFVYLSQDGCQDLVGCYGGLRGVDVSDPVVPREIRFSQEGPWFTVAAIDNMVYYHGTGGMKIISPKTGSVAAVIPDLGFVDMASGNGYLLEGNR